LLKSIINVLRGLALLRSPELLRDLRERQRHMQTLEEIRFAFPSCKLKSSLVLIGYSATRLQMGNRVIISEGTVLAFGDDQNGYGKLAVANDTWIGQYNNIRMGGGDVVIGAGCLISQFCTLVASGHGTERSRPIQQQRPPEDRRGIRLGDDVWLGAGVTVMPGITVGTGAIIGAGSVVTKNVPDYEIWAGVPAKKIGHRS
jgi:acetyltransferase-like isoleucine patch superfamily enzyme